MRNKLAHVKLTDFRTTVFDLGSTSLISRTYETPFPPVRERTQDGTFCLQVIRRSVRRTPVFGSTSRLSVSTATTWSQLEFCHRLAQLPGRRRDRWTYRILDPVTCRDMFPGVRVCVGCLTELHSYEEWRRGRVVDFAGRIQWRSTNGSMAVPRVGQFTTNLPAVFDVRFYIFEKKFFFVHRNCRGQNRIRRKTKITPPYEPGAERHMKAQDTLPRHPLLWLCQQRVQRKVLPVTTPRVKAQLNGH